MVCIPSTPIRPPADLSLPSIPIIDPTFGIKHEGIVMDFKGCVTDMASAFVNSIGVDITPCQNSISQAINFLDTAGTLTGLTGDEVNDLSSVLGFANSNLAEMALHTNNLVANMPSTITSVKTAIVSRAGFDGAPGNPCQIVDDTLGTVGAAGRELLDGLNSAVNKVLQPILDAIDAGIDFIADNILEPISDIVAGIETAAAAILTKIDNELAALQEILAEATSFATGQALNSLIGDPCLAGIIGSIGNDCIKETLNERFPIDLP